MSDRNSQRGAAPTRRTLLGGAATLGVAAALSGTAARAQSGTPSDAAAIDLSGKSVLITGTSSGFGRLSALHLASLGATVIATMRNMKGGKRAEAQELADLASRDKLKISLIEVDVTKDDQVSNGVREGERIAGRALDVVMSNAGIAISGPVEIHDHATLMRQFDVNLFGSLRVARAALPAMRTRGEGLIVQVTSQLGRLILPNVGVYCGTKFAAEAMFEAMAYEIAPFGVEISIVQPGGYPTKIWDNGARYSNELLADLDEERKSAYAAHIEMAQRFFGGGGSTDPMDVPRAVADLIAMPNGARPLRRTVHPNTQASDAANAAMAQVQAAVLGNGPYKDWHAAVTG